MLAINSRIFLRSFSHSIPINSRSALVRVKKIAIELICKWILRTYKAQKKFLTSSRMKMSMRCSNLSSCKVDLTLIVFSRIGLWKTLDGASKQVFLRLFKSIRALTSLKRKKVRRSNFQSFSLSHIASRFRKNFVSLNGVPGLTIGLSFGVLTAFKFIGE